MVSVKGSILRVGSVRLIRSDLVRFGSVRFDSFHIAWLVLLQHFDFGSLMVLSLPPFFVYSKPNQAEQIFLLLLQIRSLRVAHPNGD